MGNVVEFDAVIPNTGELVEFRGGRLALPGEATAVTLQLPETMTREDWLGVGEQLRGAQRSVSWWIGDWLRYGHRRWGEKYKDAMELTGAKYDSLRRVEWVAERFSQTDRRRTDLSWNHHAEVAGLTPDIADELLNQAAANNLSVQKLRVEVHRRKNIVGAHPSADTCTVRDLSALAATGWRCATVYADPPWLYGNQGTRAATGNHYDGMSIEEITALPVAELLLPDAHLHLWTTNAFLFEAKAIMEAWGFTYKSVFVWVKPQMGIGNYWRVSHEFLLLGVRGDCPFRDRGQMSWREIPRGKHSAKPEVVRSIIEKVSPGPYLELFGRSPAHGWYVWGNEIERGLLFRDVPEVA